MGADGLRGQGAEAPTEAEGPRSVPDTVAGGSSLGTATKVSKGSKASFRLKGAQGGVTGQAGRPSQTCRFHKPVQKIKLGPTGSF